MREAWVQYPLSPNEAWLKEQLEGILAKLVLLPDHMLDEELVHGSRTINQIFDHAISHGEDRKPFAELHLAYHLGEISALVKIGLERKGILPAEPSSETKT